MSTTENDLHIDMESPETIINDWKEVHQGKTIDGLTLVDTPYAKGVFKTIRDESKMLAFVSSVQYFEKCNFIFSNSHLANGWLRLLLNRQNCLLIKGDTGKESKSLTHNNSLLRFRGKNTYWEPSYETNSPYEVAAIFVSTQWLEEMGIYIVNSEDNIPDENSNRIFTLAIQLNIRQILEQTFTAAKQSPASLLSDKVLISHLWTLIYSCLKQYSDSIKKSKLSVSANTIEDIEKKLRAVKEEMVKDFSNSELTLDYWSRIAGMNRTKFQESFKKLFNVSFFKFYQEARFNEALRLLKTESYTTTATANAIGYKNVGYFIKEFQKRFGMKPNEYKKIKEQE